MSMIDEAIEAAVRRALGNELAAMEARIKRAISDATGGSRISLEEAARRMGVTRLTAWHWAKAGRFPYSQNGPKGRILVDPSDLPAPSNDADEIETGIAAARGRR